MIVDVVLALAALAGFGTFLYIIVSFVPEPSLIVVFGLAFAAVIVDFARQIFVKRGDGE